MRQQRDDEELAVSAAAAILAGDIGVDAEEPAGILKDDVAGQDAHDEAESGCDPEKEEGIVLHVPKLEGDVAACNVQRKRYSSGTVATRYRVRSSCWRISAGIPFSVPYFSKYIALMIA